MGYGALRASSSAPTAASDHEAIRRVMSASQFGGLWTYPSTTHPTHSDFMLIDEVRGRIITFIVLSDGPLQHGAMRLWYQPASPTSIKARLRPTNEWRVHDFQLDGD